MTRLRILYGHNADIRYGLCSLLKDPAYSLVAVLSLAVGIGAKMAMFSLIHQLCYPGCLGFPNSSELERKECLCDKNS